METKSVRYNWIDVFKGFSIFFILYAHLNASGKFAAYVFSFMVHAFFFAGGLMASRNKDLSLAAYTAKRFKQIMIPYFSYGLFAMLVVFLINTETQFSITKMTRQLVLGMRTDAYAVTLWFLPCIFFVGIYYQALLKIIKNKWFRFAVCIAISFVFRLFSEGNKLPWGIDNAVRFLIYYAAGDAFADILNNLSLKPQLIWQKKWPLLLIFIAVFLSYMHHQYGYTYFAEVAGIPTVYLVLVLLIAFYAFVGIFLFSMISILLQDVTPLQNVGKASLVICCMQLPIDRFVYSVGSMLGLSIQSTTQGECLALTALFVILGVKASDFIKKYLPATLGIFPAKTK